MTYTVYTFKEDSLEFNNCDAPNYYNDVAANAVLPENAHYVKERQTANGFDSLMSIIDTLLESSEGCTVAIYRETFTANANAEQVEADKLAELMGKMDEMLNAGNGCTVSVQKKSFLMMSGTLGYDDRTELIDAEIDRRVKESLRRCGRSDNEIKEIMEKQSPKDIHDKFISELEDTDDIELRVCDNCGCWMLEGICVDNGFGYYCSKECMNEDGMSDETFEELYANGDGDTFFTTWF